ASDETAKEVKLFGLSGHLIQRYATLADEFYRANRGLAVRRAAAGAALSAFSTLVYYGAYGFSIWQTVLGVLTIGTLTFLSASVRRSRGLIPPVLLGFPAQYQQSLVLWVLFAFLEMRPRITQPPDPPPVPRPVRQGFVFADVGFKYPGSERWALPDVSFAL